MIRRLTPWWVVALSPLLTIPVGLLAPAPAQASPVDNYVAQNAAVICDTIYARPLLSTIDAVVAAVMKDTAWGAYDAGKVVGQATYQYCPENSAVIDRYIAVYASEARYLA